MLNAIRDTFPNLKTKGLAFLSGSDIKLEYSSTGSPDTYTYQQGFMVLMDFYANALLNEGNISEGRALANKEQLTPLVKNFIVEAWLDSIDTQETHQRNQEWAHYSAETHTGLHPKASCGAIPPAPPSIRPKIQRSRNPNIRKRWR